MRIEDVEDSEREKYLLSVGYVCDSCGSWQTSSSENLIGKPCALPDELFPCDGKLRKLTEEDLDKMCGS